MKKLLTTTIISLAAMAASVSTANATAYKVTVNDKTTTVCYAAKAAWTVYGAATEGQAQATIEKLGTDTAASKKCVKQKAAKKAAKAAPVTTETTNN